MKLPTRDEALPGRDVPMPVVAAHAVSGHPLQGPFPPGMQLAMFGMGCFWGAERLFWQCEGVYSTAVGYAAGYTPNPTYEEVCSGMTGHNEVVRLVFDSARVSYAELLRLFWEGHDPTQGMRQGNDVGTQYRSAVYVFDALQQLAATTSRACFQGALTAAGYGEITTEIVPAPPFYFAEAYHQQYLARNPQGYCGLGGCGVRLAAAHDTAHDLAAVEEIIDFWFSARVRSLWFQSTAAFDDELRVRFLPTWQAACAGQLTGWMATAEGCLALVICLDQFPLNMFRGQAESFSSEAAARAVAALAIEWGFDQSLPVEQRGFLYLPYMHSESLADQECSVALYRSLGQAESLHYAQHHREIVQRFGRFPHRNAILGRENSPEEQAWLASDEAYLG